MQFAGQQVTLLQGRNHPLLLKDFRLRFALFSHVRQQTKLTNSQTSPIAQDQDFEPIIPEIAA